MNKRGEAARDALIPKETATKVLSKLDRASLEASVVFSIKNLVGVNVFSTLEHWLIDDWYAIASNIPLESKDSKQIKKINRLLSQLQEGDARSFIAAFVYLSGLSVTLAVNVFDKVKPNLLLKLAVALIETDSVIKAEEEVKDSFIFERLLSHSRISKIKGYVWALRVLVAHRLYKAGVSPDVVTGKGKFLVDIGYLDDSVIPFWMTDTLTSNNFALSRVAFKRAMSVALSSDALKDNYTESTMLKNLILLSNPLTSSFICPYLDAFSVTDLDIKTILVLACHSIKIDSRAILKHLLCLKITNSNYLLESETTLAQYLKDNKPEAKFLLEVGLAHNSLIAVNKLIDSGVVSHDILSEVKSRLSEKELI